MVFLLACGGGTFPGYRELSPDLHVRLDALGDGERQPTDSDSVQVRLRCAARGAAPGSLFSTEGWFSGLSQLIPAEAVRSLRLREGDSASLLLRAARVPPGAPLQARPVADTAWVSIEISLLSVRSHAESRRLAHERLMGRTAADEERILASFFGGSSDRWARHMGVHYTAIEGSGPLLVSGRQLNVHYTARFLDSGRVFDDTRKGGVPLTFRLGDPGQVIKGLEIALHLLPDGGRGRFVFPSALAFGATGSTSGIVPPCTPVLYEVEVNAVNEGAPPDGVRASANGAGGGAGN
jgi:hypothetical protein